MESGLLIDGFLSAAAASSVARQLPQRAAWGEGPSHGPSYLDDDTSSMTGGRAGRNGVGGTGGCSSPRQQELKKGPTVSDFPEVFLMEPFLIFLQILKTLFGYEPYPGFCKNVDKKMEAELKGEVKQKKKIT